MQAEERVTLASLRQQGWSMRAIACLQERSPCTISRELRRNSSDERGTSVPPPSTHASKGASMHAHRPSSILMETSGS